jgi:hypothetical protein
MTKSSNPSRNTSSENKVSLAVEVTRRAVAFSKQANAILATHESAKSRIITIEESYKELTSLSIKQDDLFRQALRCIEHSLYRAAHVLAWAGLMDFFEEKLAKDQFKKLAQSKPNWKLKSIEDLRDLGSDFQVVEVLRELGLCSKIEEKALKGLLNRRNECAHPTDYYPQLNETLGYISETLQRLGQFQKRW